MSSRNLEKLKHLGPVHMTTYQLWASVCRFTAENKNIESNTAINPVVKLKRLTKEDIDKNRHLIRKVLSPNSKKPGPKSKTQILMYQNVSEESDNSDDSVIEFSEDSLPELVSSKRLNLVYKKRVIKGDSDSAEDIVVKHSKRKASISDEDNFSNKQRKGGTLSEDKGKFNEKNNSRISDKYNNIDAKSKKIKAKDEQKIPDLFERTISMLDEQSFDEIKSDKCNSVKKHIKQEAKEKDSKIECRKSNKGKKPMVSLSNDWNESVNEAQTRSSPDSKCGSDFKKLKNSSIIEEISSRDSLVDVQLNLNDSSNSIAKQVHIGDKMDEKACSSLFDLKKYNESLLDICFTHKLEEDLLQLQSRDDRKAVYDNLTDNIDYLKNHRRSLEEEIDSCVKFVKDLYTKRIESVGIEIKKRFDASHRLFDLYKSDKGDVSSICSEISKIYEDYFRKDKIVTETQTKGCSNGSDVISETPKKSIESDHEVNDAIDHIGKKSKAKSKKSEEKLHTELSMPLIDALLTTSRNLTSVPQDKDPNTGDLVGNKPDSLSRTNNPMILKCDLTSKSVSVLSSLLAPTSNPLSQTTSQKINSDVISYSHSNSTDRPSNPLNEPKIPHVIQYSLPKHANENLNKVNPPVQSNCHTRFQKPSNQAGQSLTIKQALNASSTNDSKGKGLITKTKPNTVQHLPNSSFTVTTASAMQRNTNLSGVKSNSNSIPQTLPRIAVKSDLRYAHPIQNQPVSNNNIYNIGYRLPQQNLTSVPQNTALPLPQKSPIQNTFQVSQNTVINYAQTNTLGYQPPSNYIVNPQFIPQNSPNIIPGRTSHLQQQSFNIPNRHPSNQNVSSQYNTTYQASIPNYVKYNQTPVQSRPQGMGVTNRQQFPQQFQQQPILHQMPPPYRLPGSNSAVILNSNNSLKKTVIPDITINPISIANVPSHDLPGETDMCFICGEKARIKCCGLFVYCSQDCQKDDRDRHETECVKGK